MALGFSAAKANAMLDLWENQPIYIQLHTAAPGAGGVAVIPGTIRKLIPFGAAAAGGVKASTAGITWAAGEIADNVDPSHCSYWTALTGGTCIGTGTLGAGLIAAGSTFTIPSGQVQVSLNVLV